MNFYRTMCRLPRPSSYLGKILLVSFVGVHVPMIGAVVYVLVAHSASIMDSLDILIALLVATLLGTAATLAALYALLAPVTAAAGALRDYLEHRTIPTLPTRYRDRAGVLMANVQEAITRLDTAVDAAEAQRDDMIRTHREKFELLASMSHELRTPLNHVIGFAELMSSEVLGPLGSAKYRHYANDIGTSGGGLLEIVQNVLDLSAAEAGTVDVSVAPVDLGEIVTRSVNLMHLQAQNLGVSVDVERDPGKPLLVRVDGRNLKQMLMHTLQISLGDQVQTTRVHVSVDGSAGIATVVVQSNAKWLDGDVPRELLRPSAGGAAGQGDNFASSNPTALRLSLVASLARLTDARFRVGVGADGGRQMVIQMPLVSEADLSAAA